MQRNQIVALSTALLIGLFLASCKSKVDQNRPPVMIPVVQVKSTDVPIRKEFVGEVFGVVDIPIRARVDGWIEKIEFNEGQGVTAGQVLYRIDPEPFKADVTEAMSNLAEAQTMLARAESDYSRYKPLAEINAVSQSDLDYAKAEYEASLASVEAAQANLDLANIRLGYTVIKSPITGLIGKTEAKVGEYVGKPPNPVILNTVSRIDTVRVQFFLTEADYLTLARKVISNEMFSNLTEEQQEEIRNLYLKLADGSTLPYPGKVDFIDREVNPTTGTILVQASFPNPQRLLRPGQFARVQAILDYEKDAILVPQKAVMEIQGLHKVYVVQPDSTLKSTLIQVGPTFKDYWVVTEGIKTGDRVVLEGLQKVSDGMKISPETTVFQSNQAQ